MFMAYAFYILLFSTLLLIFPFVSIDNMASDLAILIIDEDNYSFIRSALYSDEYIFTYLFVVIIITMIQICFLLSIIEKHIRKRIKIILSSKDKKDECKQLKIFDKKHVKTKLSLNKVFINYCRMIN